MRIDWTGRARDDLASLREYIEQESPEAAQRVALRIVAPVATLSDHPTIGRPGRVRGTRELVVTGTPFIIAYRVRIAEACVEVLRVLHGAMRWPERV